jgi:HPt (histidine-containing phosphotransfer) domain-containing protein
VASVELYCRSVPEILDPRVVDQLRESVGGDDAFLAELIDEFLEDGPRQLQALREAAGADDADRARRAAHTLKGNGRTFGAAALSDLCLELETAAAAGDLDAVRARLDAVDDAWTELQAALVAKRDAMG